MLYMAGAAGKPPGVVGRSDGTRSCTSTEELFWVTAFWRIMSFAIPEIQFVDPLTDQSLVRFAVALANPLTLRTPEVEFELSHVDPA